MGFLKCRTSMAARLGYPLAMQGPWLNTVGCPFPGSEAAGSSPSVNSLEYCYQIWSSLLPPLRRVDSNFQDATKAEPAPYNHMTAYICFRNHERWSTTPYPSGLCWGWGVVIESLSSYNHDQIQKVLKHVLNIRVIHSVNQTTYGSRCDSRVTSTACIVEAMRISD